MTDILVYTEEQDNVIAGSVEPREIVVAVVGEVGGGGGSSAVESVNGQLGHVVLDAADVGADAAGTAAGAVAGHEAALDPHPQYTTASEAAAAAPVQTVNAQTGAVVLSAADVGADAAGTAGAAVAAHEAALDPHPQYTTAAEASAAAPVQAVNAQTGAVVLDASDVGADPTGTAAAAVAGHEAAADPHPQYTTQTEVDASVSAHNSSGAAHADIRSWTNEVAVGALTTGLLNHNNGAYLAALNDTTLHVNPLANVFFSEMVGLVADPSLNFAQQDVPLSAVSLPADGVYIRFVGINASGVVSFQTSAINTDPARAQLGIVYLKRVSGVTSFLDGAVGPRNVRTIPILSNVSYTDRAYHELRSTVGLAPNANLTMKMSAGDVHGEAINWGDPNDVNTKAVSAADPMPFLLFSAGTGATGVVPAPTTLFDPTKYWNGTSLVTLTTANKASVQRVLITITGTVIVQYGETEYASLSEAASAMYTSPFTRIFDDLLAIEIARVAMTRACTNLQDSTSARVVLLGFGSAGASGGGGTGSVDSVNGQTGTVVLDTDDISEGATNKYFTNARAAAAAPVQSVDGQTGAVSLSGIYAPLSHVGSGGTAHSAASTSVAGFMSAADKTKLDGVAVGATQNSSDAVLLSRANHTGTQTASTISDFNSAARAQVEAELVAGTNVTITPSGSGATRQLTVAAASGASLAQVVAFAGAAKTLALTDINTVIDCTSSSAVTITIPPQSSVTWTADAEIHVRRSGAGVVSIAVGAGVTIPPLAAPIALSGQGAMVTLKRRSADVWAVVGSVVGGPDVVGPASAVDNEVARFDGTTGKKLKAGLKYQSSQTDTTAGALVIQGGQSLITSDAVAIGFGTGSGGTVTQATSKSTGVTLNKPVGRVVVNAASLAAGAAVSFSVSNSTCGINDLVVINAEGSAAGNYSVELLYAGAGAFGVRITNITGGALAESINVKFAIIKGAIA